MINDLLEKWSSRILLKTPETSLLFENFFNKSWSMSAKLKCHQGQRVVIISRDREFVLIALWAIWMRSSIAVPINPAFPERIIWQMVKQCCSNLLISDNASFKHKPEGIQIHEPKKLSKENVYVSRPLKLSIHEDDPALVIFTSGSTGRPKAVVLSLGNLFFNADGANSQMRLGPGNQWLLSLPLFHVGGLGILFRCLVSGASMVLADPSLALEDQLSTEKITHLSLVPTQLQRLLETGKGPGLLQKLELVLLGGAFQPSPILEKSKTLGLQVRTSYGCTEMASQIATGNPKYLNGQWVASGLVLPHREVKLSDKGEILVRGKTRFLGYLNEKKKAEKPGFPGLDKPFDPNGWFATGDLGEWYNNGEQQPWLRITGRKDTMFVTGGENIHPEEIEAQIQDHPKVLLAVVVPVDDRDFGTRPVVFLKGKDPENYPDEQELRHYLSFQLARYQIPELFLLLESQNSKMKPQRMELSRIAQSRYNTWKKVEPLRTLLIDNLPGWKKIMLCNGKQIFEVRRHFTRSSTKAYYSAVNRQQVMDFLCTVTKKEIEKAAWETNDVSNEKMHPIEPFEVIRMVEDDCMLSEMIIWDIHKKKPVKYRKSVHFPNKALICQGINDYLGSVELGGQIVEYGFCAPEFSPFPETACGQAVFQSGVIIPTWNRLYLLRCLYSFELKSVMFQGWKVHCSQDMKTGKKLKHLIWKLKPQEEYLLESVLIRQNLVSGLDLKNANTPTKDRERRKLFSSLLKKNRI